MTPLAQLLARLPRVGEATAARLAVAIAEQPDDWREALAREVLAEGRPARCRVCRDEPQSDPCRCQDPAIPASPILVVATPSARRSVCRAWTGQTHVLGGRYHGVDVTYVREGGITLLERCRNPAVTEVLLALGDEEAEQALAETLRTAGVDVWALGQGIGCGHDVEHASAAEIVASLTHRRVLL